MAHKNFLKGIKELDDETFVIGDGMAVVSLANTARAERETTKGTILVPGAKTEDAIAFWGYNNNLPEEREILISNNNIVPQLIATKRNIILGTGNIIGYNEVFENGKRRIEQVAIPAEIDERLDENKIESEYLPMQIKNLLVHGGFFSEFYKGNSVGGLKNEYVKLIAKDSKYTRSGLQDKTGRVQNFYVSNIWAKQTGKNQVKQNIEKIAAFDGTDSQSKFMMYGADKLLGGPYYYTPHWEGNWTWIKVANCIPDFHYSNIENGFSIRYLVKIPDGYFFKMLSRKQRESDKSAEFESKKRKDFIAKLNNFFLGAKNAGKAMVTQKYVFEHIQKTYEGIEIEAINVDLKDEAMLRLFETTNSANTSSHGTPPALAGIATGAKMTSGSEIKNLYNFYQTVVAPYPRKLIFQHISKFVNSFNKDKKLKLGLEDVVLTTTDDDKTGKKIQNIDHQ